MHVVWWCGCKQLLAPAQLRGIMLCKCILLFFLRFPFFVVASLLAFSKYIFNALMCLVADVRIQMLVVWWCGYKQLIAPAQLKSIMLFKCIVCFFLRYPIFFWQVCLHLVNTFFWFVVIAQFLRCCCRRFCLPPFFSPDLPIDQMLYVK